MNNRNNSSLNIIILIAGFISSITGIVANSAQLIGSKQTPILLLIGFNLIILYLLINQNKKRKEAGKKRLNIYFWLTSSLTISIIATLLFESIFTPKKTGNEYIFNKELIGIGISNFDNDTNFSSLVYEFIKEEKLSDTIFDIKKINRNYFDYIGNACFDKSIDSLCLSSGIIVSGKRNSSDKLFYCKIRLKNFHPNILKDSSDHKLITLRNPDIQEFSIDHQAQLLADFILALIAYHQNDVNNAERLFKQCIIKNHNMDNKKFLSICRVYLGNIYKYAGNDEKAIDEYSKAINLHKSDAAIINIVNNYLHVGNYIKAKSYYDKIQNKKDGNLEEVRKRLQSLQSDLNQKKNPEKVKVITIPPQGTFYFNDTDSTKITINYSSITQFDYLNNIFFIYKADNDHYGVINSHGLLISLPDFADISNAKKHIMEMLK